MAISLGIGLGIPRISRSGNAVAQPSDFIPSLRYWHHAELSDIIPGTGGIDEITDLSGNGSSLIQPNEVARPALIAGGINGHDAIDFEGVTEVMWSDDVANYFVDFSNGTVSWFVGIVLRMLDNVDTQRISGTHDSTNSVGYQVNYRGANGDFIFDVGNGSAGIVNFTGASLAINTDALLGFGFNATANRYEIFINDGTITTATPGGAESASDPATILTLGRRFGTNALNLDGYIGENYGGTGISPTDAQADAWAWAQSYFGL